ncbi:MAG: putative 4 fimbrial pilE-related [Gammaproteobacteria bacterium]|jgi:type IV pilus assembly protein PilE|nr:putative 4 fimbrial pilE-related [Gammaproteobacteria bacterium]
MMQTPMTSRDSGFTLVELMVTLVIAAILVAIAVPSYTSQIRKSKRTDAKTALLDLAGREERYMATNSSYSTDGNALGYGAAFPITLSNNDYTISAPVVVAADNTTSPPTPASYALTATAVNIQAKDTSCATFSLNNRGVQTATSTTCW